MRKSRAVDSGVAVGLRAGRKFALENAAGTEACRYDEGASMAMNADE
jgi:hypothetical protein